MHSSCRINRSVIGWREIILQIWWADQREIIVAICLVGLQFSLFTNRLCLCLREAYTYNLEIFLLQGTALPVLFPRDVIKCVRDSVILCIKSVCRLHEIAVWVCVCVYSALTRFTASYERIWYICFGVIYVWLALPWKRVVLLDLWNTFLRIISLMFSCR